MTQDLAGIDLVGFVRILRRRAIPLVLCIVLGGVVAFLISEHQQKLYTAKVSLLFQNPEINQQAAGVQVISNNDPQLLTATQIALASLVPVANATANQVGHGVTPNAVSHDIRVSEQGQTDVATVSATYPNPQRAATIANTFARLFIAQRRAQEQGNVKAAIGVVNKQIAAMTPTVRGSAQGQALVQRAASLDVLSKLQTGDALIVKQATAPTSPSSPKVPRNVAIGVALGLLVGLLLALLLERFDRRLKDVRDLEEELGLPLLGSVPESKDYGRGLRANRADGLVMGHAEVEAFRMLRAHLRYYNVDRSVQSVLVSSCSSGEGKTTVACYLAEAAARMGSRVLLIETDMRRPSVASMFGLTEGPGLSDVLISLVDQSEAVQSVNRGVQQDGVPTDATGMNKGLDVLPAGPIPPNPAELLESQAMEQVLEWASLNYELVVVDTPPLLVVADAIPLLKMVGGIIVVTRVGETTRDQVGRLRKQLVSMSAPTLGFVANRVKADSAVAKEYGYYRSDSAPRPPKVPAQG